MFLTGAPARRIFPDHLITFRFRAVAASAPVGGTLAVSVVCFSHI